MVSRPFPRQRDQWYRTAVEGLRFTHHPGDEMFSPPQVRAWRGQMPVGSLTYYPDNTDHPAYRALDNDGSAAPGMVKYITVDPSVRRQGIATALYDWTKGNVAPHLHHSPNRTGPGAAWAQHEMSRHGYLRIAAIADETLNRLRNEFHQWWNEDVDHGGYTPIQAREAMGYWGSIESFLKARYPAASRDTLFMGMEQVMPMLRQRNIKEWGDVPKNADPYETGREAVEKYGYDPAEVAAGMLVLHNDGRPGRQEYQNANRNLLLKIIRNRRRMQKEYDSVPRQLELPFDDAQQAIVAARRMLAAYGVDYDDTPYWADAWDDEDDDDPPPTKCPGRAARRHY